LLLDVGIDQVSPLGSGDDDIHLPATAD